MRRQLLLLLAFVSASLGAVLRVPQNAINTLFEDEKVDLTSSLWQTIPESYTFDYSLWGFIPLHLELHDLSFHADIEAKNTQVTFDRDGFISLTTPKMKKALLKGSLPLPSSFGLLPSSCSWTMALSDFVIATDFKLVAFADGAIQEVKVDKGTFESLQTKIMFDHWLVNLVLGNLVDYFFSLQATDISVVNWALEPISSTIIQFLIQDALNAQLKQQRMQHAFYMASPVRGQNTGGHFTLDYSLGGMPQVHEGQLDLILTGEIFIDAGSRGCQLDNQSRLGFEDSENFQLSFSEGQLQCFFNSIAESSIALLDFDSQAFGAYFDDASLLLTATSLNDKFGFQGLSKKKDAHQELRIQLRLSNFQVDLGKYDADLSSKFQLEIIVATAESTPQETQLIFADKLWAEASVNLEMDKATNDLVAHFKSLELDEEQAFTTLPFQDSLGMTESEYDQFLSEMYEFLDILKWEFNSGDGLRIPTFDPSAFQSQLHIRDGYASVELEFI